MDKFIIGDFLPVSDANYSHEFNDIHFPAGEKAFSVTAENIKNIRIVLSPVFRQTIKYPLEGPKKASNGIATISISFPITWENITINNGGSQPRNVRVYGDAAENANSVNLKVDMSIKVTADSNGDFSLNITTEGVPTGEFFITAGEIEKTVSIVLTEPTPTPTSPPSPSPTPSPTPTPPIPTPVFNTGSPENPYPSIFGTHHGTITTNQTITVSSPICFYNNFGLVPDFYLFRVSACAWAWIRIEFGYRNCLICCDCSVMRAKDTWIRIFW